MIYIIILLHKLQPDFLSPDFFSEWIARKKMKQMKEYIDFLIESCFEFSFKYIISGLLPLRAKII